MKTKSTNREEIVCSFIRKQSRFIGALMITAFLTTTIATAQRATGNIMWNESQDQVGAELRNPGPQPVKNVNGTTPIVPVCTAINDLNIIDYSFDKAILGWDNSMNYDSIICRYAISGTSSYRTYAIPATPNPGRMCVFGLNSQTAYDFQISALCSSGMTSNWSSMVTLTTFAPPTPRMAANQRNTNHLYISPNPATTTTVISFAAPINSTNAIRILSTTGREVLKTQVTCVDGKLQLTVDVSAYAPGLYTVEVSNYQGISTEKLMVQ